MKIIPGAGPNAALVIVSLCDYSGRWTLPWQRAGHTVVLYDLKHRDDVRAEGGSMNAPPFRLLRVVTTTEYPGRPSYETARQVWVRCVHPLALPRHITRLTNAALARDFVRRVEVQVLK